MTRERSQLDASSAPTCLESQETPINSRATDEALYRENRAFARAVALDHTTIQAD